MRDGLAISLLTGKPVPGKARDRRRHQRVKVTLLGRYMLRDRREFPCQTIDMSPGGVLLFAPVKAEVGERVVVYLDQIGQTRTVANLKRRLERLGYHVILEPLQPNCQPT